MKKEQFERGYQLQIEIEAIQKKCKTFELALEKPINNAYTNAVSLKGSGGVEVELNIHDRYPDGLKTELREIMDDEFQRFLQATHAKMLKLIKKKEKEFDAL